MKNLFILIFTFFIYFLQSEENKKTIIRVGHFPNITHAQALIGHGLSREQQGWFEERLGPDVEVQWFVYNAGPSAMEGIFAGSIDLTYVGPSPTINAYLRSKGKEVRVICGACSSGASLVVQPDERIRINEDFKGKRVGTPQLGNTQDVAARTWLRSNGLRVTLTGGDVWVIPTENFDQLTLFQKQDLDAVWTIEPWVSRLVLEANAKVYFDESYLWPQTQGRYVTAHLASSQAFLEKHSDLIKKWIAAHVELTEWINQHPAKAKQLMNEELKKEMAKGLTPAVLDRAWANIELTYDPVRASLFKYAKEAYEIGFIKHEPDLTHLYQLNLLNEVLNEKKLPKVD